MFGLGVPPCRVGGTGGGCRLRLRLCGRGYVKVKPRKTGGEEPLRTRNRVVSVSPPRGKWKVLNAAGGSHFPG